MIKSTQKSYAVLKLSVIYMTHIIGILINCTYYWRHWLVMTTQVMKAIKVLSIILTHWLPVYEYIYHTWKSEKNQAYFSWLTNCTAPQPTALESCSNSQKTWQVFESAMKNLFGFGFQFFVSDVISKVGFWPFLAAGTWPGPNGHMEVFWWSFHWELGQDLHLLRSWWTF